METTFLRRLQVEQQELAARYIKLAAFTESDEYVGLPAEKQRLLTVQLSVMGTLNQILMYRIGLEMEVIK